MKKVDPRDCFGNVQVFRYGTEYENYHCSRDSFILKHLLEYQYSIFSSTFSCNCFEQSQRLLDGLITNFKENMQPSANLSVDETMIGFRGRFGTIKCMKVWCKSLYFGWWFEWLCSGYLTLYWSRLESSNTRYSHLPQPIWL